MLHTKVWHVDVYIGEHDGMTHAEARLRSEGFASLTASAETLLGSDDPRVPEILDEVAVAHALSALSERLLQAAADDRAGLSSPTQLSSP